MAWACWRRPERRWAACSPCWRRSPPGSPWRWGGIFTTLVDRAFTGLLLPLLGLLLLPLTTLFYVLAYRPVVGVSGWGWLVVVLGLLFDLGSYGGGARSRRR